MTNLFELPRKHFKIKGERNVFLLLKLVRQLLEPYFASAGAILCKNFKNRSLSCVLHEMFFPLTGASFLLCKTGF